MVSIFLLHSLPTDLIEKIRRLTYQSQSFELCNDIRSFVKHRECIKTKYYEYFKDFDENPLEWVSNDLIGYYNNSIPTNLRYTARFFDLFIRDSRYSKKPGDDILDDLFLKSPEIQINILLSLMLPIEREEFINKLI